MAHLIKVAHEAPLSIFDKVQGLTDYDYALVHLLDTPSYATKFENALAQGREVILDNSLYELGEAFDWDRYYDHIKKLKPTWYIIPDALGDAEQTINNVKTWFARWHSNELGKTIGVVQGKTFRDFVHCYLTIEKYVDMIAIPFRIPFPEDNNMAWSGNSDLVNMMKRQNLLKRLSECGIINYSKPHHLLGCYLPQEFQDYRQYFWIYSIDTSSPVMAGIDGKEFNGQGLDKKPPGKAAEIMFQDVTDEQWKKIKYNIHKFRSFII